MTTPSSSRSRPRDGTDAPLVVLAGHVDTVPPNGNFPGARDGDAIVGRGAADMKGALAVMLEVAAWLAREPGASDLDVGSPLLRA